MSAAQCAHSRIAGLLAYVLALSAAVVHADTTVLVNSFEDPAELGQWEIAASGARLVAEHVTEGTTALEMIFDPNGEYYPVAMFWNRVTRDWSPHDALVVDVYNPNDFPISGHVLVADQAWADKGGSYWNRHNGGTTFAPGAGRWVIPVRGLFRGEAGSRNNDIKTDIDPTQIVRLDLDFGEKGQTGRVVIDNIRFVKVDRPAGVRAFDFGPASQPVMLGWTAVSDTTVYSPEQGHGWGPQGGHPWDGAARDTTFGTMLTQDFCEAGGYRFRVDVSPGDYQVLAIFENCGYWGGEQSRHTHREIRANGALAWSEDRPDGPSTALFRFEDVEPIGVDLWDTYMAPEITRPIRVDVSAGDDGLDFAFASDVPWGAKLSALAVVPKADAAAREWLDGQLRAVADEFRAKAVCLDPPTAPFQPPPAWADRGLVAWPVTIDEDVTPGAVPQALPAPDALALAADVVRGEFEPLCLAVRPQRDLGECRLMVEWTTPNAPQATPQVVWYNTSRGFGTMAYTIRPHTVRDASSVSLPEDVTRELAVTLSIAEGTPAGVYEGRFMVTDAAGEEILSVPIRVTVHDVVLARDTRFLMGFFGLEPPAEMLPGGRAEQAFAETLGLLREHGMNGLSGGPNIRLTGWQNGVPQIDFSEADRFFDLCRAQGFGRPINGYGGLRFVGLHDGYEKGETAERVAQESGLPYEEAFMRAWEAVDAHARAAGWPLICYAMCDETRVRDVAERELEFMQLMAKATARFPETVRSSGSYSVDFGSRPTDPEDLIYWHQRFFAALDVSSLNLHDESVMAEARKLGKEIHIYNQGQTRYSFGLYQWSELAKGVTARWQWHLNVLHGYQYFDLDGREPDTAMMCYGREAIYPTIHFERCREGAEEFYLLQMLSSGIERNRADGVRPKETSAAAALLQSLTDSVTLSQRTPPPTYDPLQLKRDVVAALEAL